MDFNRLNYSLANEDSQLEYDCVRAHADHVVCIAGSGARALPLLAKAPKKLTLVDLSQAQLQLSELRLELLRTLEYHEFCAFLGYAGNMTGAERLAIFSRLDLKPATRAALFELFHANQWTAPIYYGRWERGMRKMSRLIRMICGRHVLTPFDFHDLAQQLHHLKGRIGLWRWRLAIGLLGHTTALKALRYGGGHPQLNLARTNYRFYRTKLGRAWQNSLARESFFLQLLLLGKIHHATGAPLEAEEKVFSAMQQAARSTTIEYVCSDLTTYLQGQRQISFISASDIASYLGPNEAASLYTAMAEALAPEGLAVCRYYRHRPVTRPRHLIQDVTKSYEHVSNREKTGVYDFGFYQPAAKVG